MKKNIVSSFLELFDSVGDAVDAINKAVGSKLRHDGIRRLERGQRGLNVDTNNYLLSVVLSNELDNAGIPARKRKAIIDKCLHPQLLDSMDKKTLLKQEVAYYKQRVKETKNYKTDQEYAVHIRLGKCLERSEKALSAL